MENSVCIWERGMGGGGEGQCILILSCLNQMCSSMPYVGYDFYSVFYFGQWIKQLSTRTLLSLPLAYDVLALPTTTTTTTMMTTTILPSPASQAVESGGAIPDYSVNPCRQWWRCLDVLHNRYSTIIASFDFTRLVSVIQELCQCVVWSSVVFSPLSFSHHCSCYCCCSLCRFPK